MRAPTAGKNDPPSLVVFWGLRFPLRVWGSIVGLCQAPARFIYPSFYLIFYFLKLLSFILVGDNLLDPSELLGLGKGSLRVCCLQSLFAPVAESRVRTAALGGFSLVRYFQLVLVRSLVPTLPDFQVRPAESVKDRTTVPY